MLLFHVYRRKGAIVSTSELRSLEPGNRRKYLERRAELQAMLDGIIDRGVSTGTFDTPYPGDAGRAIASMCAGVATWYRPEAPLSFHAARPLSLDRRGHRGGPLMGRVEGKVAFITGAARGRAAAMRSAWRRRAPTSSPSTSARPSRA